MQRFVRLNRPLARAVCVSARRAPLVRPAAALPSSLRARRAAPAAVVPRRLMGAEAGSFLGKEEVTDRVLETVRNFHKVEKADSVDAGVHFVKDLGLDSLDEVELVMALEEEFAIEISDTEAEKIHSVADAVDYITTHPNAK